MTLRTCPICGKEFTPGRLDVKFCGSACRNIAFIHRRNVNLGGGSRSDITNPFIRIRNFVAANVGGLGLDDTLRAAEQGYRVGSARKTVEAVRKTEAITRLPELFETLTTDAYLHCRELIYLTDATLCLRKSKGTPPKFLIDDRWYIQHEPANDAVEVVKARELKRTEATVTVVALLREESCIVSDDWFDCGKPGTRAAEKWVKVEFEAPSPGCISYHAGQKLILCESAAHLQRVLSVISAYHQYSDSRVRVSAGDTFALLGLKPGATLMEIKMAYLRMATRYHPDKGGDPQQFIRIKKAYETLTSGR